jgi:hypothetical protein
MRESQSNYVLTPTELDKSFKDITVERIRKAASQPVFSEFSDIFKRCEKVLAEREVEYRGSCDGMYSDIGKLADMLLPDNPTPGQRSAATLLALKLKRLAVNPRHDDSAVDAVSYLLAFYKELRK